MNAVKKRRTAELRQLAWRRVHNWIGHPHHPIRDPQVTRLRLELPRLPAKLSGLRVVHLSDIHYGLFLSRAAMLRIVDLTNGLNPDLVAITGDFVTQSPVFIEPVAELAARITARLGVYAVLGNHDFRAGAEALTAELTRRKIHVLRNSHLFIQYAGERIKIAGIDDSRQHPNLLAALGNGSRKLFTLLLAHNPMELAAARRAGVDLVLSGHTHGGQIQFRFAAPLYRRYAPQGLLHMGTTQMYVSRGLGKVIVPMRVGAPAELATLDLHRR